MHLPERGNIGIFNRSYYEEVLVARVHPEYLEAQRLPDGPEPDEPPTEEFWKRRFESIRDHELHLARSGTAIVKFFLNISFDEQRARFLARLDDPAKHWKFQESDIRDRARWSEYTRAYQEAIAATSTPWAPWYVIPADDKAHMRVMVAEVMVAALGSLDLQAPVAMLTRPIEEVRAAGGRSARSSLRMKSAARRPPTSLSPDASS
jgi:polyphosphate kinase 2 (PPK2 family)